MSGLPPGSLDTLHARHGAMLASLLAVVLVGAVVGSLASCGGRGGPAPELRATPSEVTTAPARLLVARTHVRGIVGEPELRVRIRSRATSIEVRGGSGIELVGARESVSIGGSSGTSLILSRSGRTWTVTRGGSRTGYELGSPIELRGVNLVVDGARHPGRLEIRTRSDNSNQFDVVEEIPVETYLSGVIAKEMVLGWDIEAFRVQAICARSYALHEMLRARSRGRSYDVENTTMDQVYGGKSTDPTVLEAVSSTKGVVLLDGYELLRAYYSSTCGGRVSGGADSWPATRDFAFNGAGPLQAAPRAFACQSSPLFRWEVTRSRSQLSARFRAYGTSQGLAVRRLRSIRGLEVIERNDAARPVRYRVLDTGGRSYELSAEQVRLACNTRASGAPSITRKTRVASGDLTMRVSGDEVVIAGRGFGHGVGMCQFCAQGFAMAGDDWRTMLRRFYPGVTMVRAYD